MLRTCLSVLPVCIALASVSVSYGQTPPAFRLSDAAGNNVTIDSTGAITFTGNASCVSGVTCSTVFSNVATPGQIVWSGNVGAFQITAVVGISKPVTGPSPLMDVSLQAVRTAAAGGTLVVRWTDTNFNVPGVTGGVMSAGGTITGTGSVLFRTFFDGTNTAFGTGTLVGTLGPFSTSAYSGSVNGPGPSASPFSMTEEITLTMGPNSIIGGDFEFRALPAPLKVTCPAATIGQVGIPYSSALIATGGIPPYTYSIIMGSLAPFGLSLNPSTGAITGTPTMAGTINFTGQVADATNGTATTGVVPCPIVIVERPSANCVAIVAIQGVPITPVTLTGIGGAGGPYTFSATGLPAGLSITPGGMIFGTPTVSGTFNYTVTVTDKNGNVGTVNCSVTVGPPPSATCVQINAVQGVPITPVQLVGTGGAGGPYTFTATGLPAGLTISSSGLISGTPTVSGTFNYTVTITDKDGNTGTVNCTVTVVGTPSATCVQINAIQGVPITPVQLVGTGGAGGPYTFTATGLPAGLTISSSGLISGTPTVSGTFNYTVTITDKDGNTGTVNCTVTVITRPSATCVEINAIQGVPITPVQLVGTGGAGGPYTFTATGLPAGLTISSSGLISGTPTVSGTFNYTVTVRDKDGNTGTVNCTVTVGTRPSVTCVQIVAVQGVPITPVQLVGTGGAGAPYTFSATGLPAGLTISSSGVISGTPTVSGTFNYVVTVTDKNGVSGSVNCSVTVTPPPPPCIPATFLLSGNSPLHGTAGNIKTFTATNGVQVKASAFSRAKSNGAWSTAYLGSYPGGLGVTDGSEGDGSNNQHKVDNIGARTNYVLFEFSAPVIVNRAFLDIVGADSDITVWIGTKTDPFNNHITLSDAVLTSLGFTEVNPTTSSDSRWADINAGGTQGNVLVIAAQPDDTTPEDDFKIEKIDTACPPTTVCTGSIGNFVWKDTNNNGLQDSGEPGIAGVNVQLKNGSTVLATTTTNSQGFYQFNGVCAGTYTVTVLNPPSGYTASPSNVGSNRAIDSNGSPATVTLPANNSTDQTIDFGYVPPTTICVPTTFVMEGNSATSGAAGNIKTFTAANGVQVKASAFSRDKSSGAWATAYLGAYESGLGVTDGSEGSGGNNQHKSTTSAAARTTYCSSSPSQ